MPNQIGEMEVADPEIGNWVHARQPQEKTIIRLTITTDGWITRQRMEELAYVLREVPHVTAVAYRNLTPYNGIIFGKEERGMPGKYYVCVLTQPGESAHQQIMEALATHYGSSIVHVSDSVADAVPVH